MTFSNPILRHSHLTQRLLLLLFFSVLLSIAWSNACFELMLYSLTPPPRTLLYVIPPLPPTATQTFLGRRFDSFVRSFASSTSTRFNENLFSNAFFCSYFLEDEYSKELLFQYKYRCCYCTFLLVSFAATTLFFRQMLIVVVRTVARDSH